MIKGFFKRVTKKDILFLWIVAFLLVLFSFMEFSSSESMRRRVEALEKRIHRRESVLQAYVAKVLDAPHSEFVSFKDFPEDMVIYRYFDDTLQSWINEFPISNDVIDFYSPAHRMYHMNSRAVPYMPLAFLNQPEQYVSLGSAWYIVNIDKRYNQTVISALLIQTDYPTENSVLVNKTNPKLSIRSGLSIVPVTHDESYVVKGKNGGVLFSMLRTLPNKANQTGFILRWIAIFLIGVALFLNLYRRRRVRDFVILLLGLIAIALVAFYQSKELRGDIALFSSNVYADSDLFNSLGNLLIFNLLIYLALLAMYIISKRLAIAVYRASKVKRYLLSAPYIAIPLMLIPYIHFSFRSVILNSNIVMELYKIDEISLYTVVVYLSYALLFMGLLFSFQMLRPFMPAKRRISFTGNRPILIYTILVSLYSVILVGSYGLSKEYTQNRVLTVKLSVDRDLNTELQLKEIEKQMGNDYSLMFAISWNNQEYIESSLKERYLWSILQRYVLKDVTLCVGQWQSQRPNPHFAYWDNIIDRYGTKLDGSANFYYMNYYNGRINYTGVISLILPVTLIEYRLYIELESKPVGVSVGYPDILLDHKKSDNYNLPPGYSYAKYIDDRLNTFGGNFNYPISIDSDSYADYEMERRDGYIHFVNRITPDNVVMLSRPDRGRFSYLLSFSYLMLFYSFLVAGPSRIRRREFIHTAPHNTFRWKITVLILSSLVIALACMGVGSIWFTIRYFEENNVQQMEQKLQVVQSTLSKYSMNVRRFNDQEFNNLALLESMRGLSASTEMDINVYGSDGFLLRTTRIEMFDGFIIGKRINAYAYDEIVHRQRKQFIHRESIGNVSYHSLYAPLYNTDGNLIAIINIPYFSKQNDFSRDASSIIAAIINIYLLLLIAAVFVGITLSNSISRPLAEISKKMERLDITKQPEHIDYNNRDELGILVAAYNKMVDVLNESTIRLAQSEREQAWREMARQIAHEIKNPLTPMRLSIQHLLRLKSRGVEDWGDRFDALANSLIEQIDILSDAAGEFSSFSRFYSEEISRFELNDLIREQIVLFSTSDNIRITLDSAEKRAYIVARKNQITRVFVNLLSNAVQAVESQESGKIAITLERRGDKYVISVEDSGLGVPNSLTNRLFKPNFTTKTGGTGLGLAICRSIIEQSQGKITYRRSEQLGGASFVIEMPLFV